MMKHGGSFLSPCSFFAKQLKSTDHTDDTEIFKGTRITLTTRIFLALVLRKRSHRNQSSDHRNLDGSSEFKRNLNGIF